MVEEYVGGQEYSVEYISWQGRHQFLAITEKFTTGAPHYIETGHLEPARLDAATQKKVQQIVEHALDSLGVEYGASHSELKIDNDGKIAIIEIGSRMGGDCIGSHLVQLSTGYDFVDAVIDVALGIEPPLGASEDAVPQNAAIRFVFSDDDIAVLDKLKGEDACGTVKVEFVSEIEDTTAAIVDSGTRHGFYIFTAADVADIEPHLPANKL